MGGHTSLSPLQSHIPGGLPGPSAPSGPGACPSRSLSCLFPWLGQSVWIRENATRTCSLGRLLAELHFSSKLTYLSDARGLGFPTPPFKEFCPVCLQTAYVQGRHGASSTGMALIFSHVGWSSRLWVMHFNELLFAGRGPKGLFIMKGSILKTLITHSLFKTHLLVGQGRVCP